MNVGKFAVVQPGAAEPGVVQLETEWPDQVQRRAAVGRQAYDVAGVGRNFRLVEGDLNHDWGG